MLFRDREEAGRLLAQALAGYQGRANLVVLGLPRGGVPIAQIVGDSLGAPMDVLLVRKLGVPQATRASIWRHRGSPWRAGAHPGL